MATHTRPVPVETPSPDTCSLCSEPDYTACDDCERRICTVHTHIWLGFCQLNLLLCPDCYAARAKAQERKD